MRLHIQQRSQVRWKGQKARTTRKAITRTRACSRLKAKHGERNSGKKMSSGKLQIPSGMSLSGIKVQKFGRLRQPVHSLRCSERSTPMLYLRTLRNHPCTCNIRTRSGSSSITTRLQLRQPYLWNFLMVFRCTKCVSSSLRMVRTFPTSTEPSFRQVDEFGNKRKMDNSRIADGRRREYHRLCQLHNYHGILPS